MPSFRLTLAAAFIVASFGIHSASALEIDTTGTKAGANFSDPDDAVPFPHVADDGTAASANFQMEPAGPGGVNFGFTPNNAQPSAFQRAQERFQQ